ncbi:unnamed protein product [Caenorhabditis sp. 36 PRJEB53466]|nr:unnamed protein product [Caenorhabditis sp. 36 PRJEB53466]
MHIQIHSKLTIIDAENGDKIGEREIREKVDNSLFQLTPSDSILFSTSLLFDPSIVELFMAFRSGCQLILTADSFRTEPHRMQAAIDRFRPTVGQFTPTVFEMLPSGNLLSAASSLRILLLGGSHFPLQLVRSTRHPDNRTRVFNVYGVTEVSCWATIFEVDAECEDVLLGEEVGGSTVEVTEQGELLIGGPRQCYVNGVKKENHHSGDRVERTTGGLRITGRIDRLIKHRGIRICLDHLTALALRENPEIRAVHYLHHNERNLVQFTVGPTSSSTKKHCKSMKLDAATVIPVTVVDVAQMPINSSGKVDEKELLKILDILETDEDETFLEKLEKALDSMIHEDSEETFVSLGLKSLQAAVLSSHFGAQIEGEAMRAMLDPKTTIRAFLEKFKPKKRPRQQETRDIVHVKVHKTAQPRMRWAVDLKKCIDGNVLIVNESLVVCASHSGAVVAMNPRNGRCLWRTECGVRFEATPTLADGQIVLGNKVNGLFFLSLDSGELLAQHKYDVEAEIGVRASCAFDGQFLYCTSENGTFHAVHPTTRLPVFNLKIGQKPGGTSVGPVQGPDGAIYATTTAGTVARITVASKKCTWQRDFGPIFAEPTFSGESMFVLNVHGKLHILHPESGEIQDKITLENEHCFCAPLIIDSAHLLVATQSGKLIQLRWTPNLTVRKEFRFDLPPISFVKTPKIWETGEIILMSKNGWILIGRLGKLDEMRAIPMSEKEIFTAPEILNDGRTILTAGRDDYLRAWNVELNSFWI